MTTQTQTLADFLLTRIAEDEAWAIEAINLAVIYDNPKWHWIVSHDDGSRWQPTNATPRRVLAECEAKRRIVDLHVPTTYRHGPEACAVCTQWDDYPWRVEVGEDRWPCATLRLLALPYADHPDFREEWRA